MRLLRFLYHFRLSRATTIRYEHFDIILILMNVSLFMSILHSLNSQIVRMVVIMVVAANVPVK